MDFTFKCFDFYFWFGFVVFAFVLLFCFCIYCFMFARFLVFLLDLLVLFVCSSFSCGGVVAGFFSWFLRFLELLLLLFGGSFGWYLLLLSWCSCLSGLGVPFLSFFDGLLGCSSVPALAEIENTPNHSLKKSIENDCKTNPLSTKLLATTQKTIN